MKASLKERSCFIMWYGVLSLCAVMFSVQFLFNQQYQKDSGTSINSSFRFALITCVSAFVCLFIINGFRIEFTLFSLIMAVLASLVNILYTICSIKAFAYINLSLYSIFAMLGGMLLPFLVGIIFYEENVTVAKIVCLVLISAALLLTVERGKSKKGTIFYIGVFILNGLNGVVSTVFQSAPYEKTGAAGYSILIVLCTFLIATIYLLIDRKGWQVPTMRATGWALGYGIICRVANYLLLLALVFLPASVNYPFITGGTMICSTVISALTGSRPSKREILSVAVSFTGILLLVLLPF